MDPPAPHYPPVPGADVQVSHRRHGSGGVTEHAFACLSQSTEPPDQHLCSSSHRRRRSPTSLGSFALKLGSKSWPWGSSSTRAHTSAMAGMSWTSSWFSAGESSSLLFVCCGGGGCGGLKGLMQQIPGWEVSRHRGKSSRIKFSHGTRPWVTHLQGSVGPLWRCV